MPPTLLADLVLMMSSSPEDVATRALELLLGRSAAARNALDGLLGEWRGRAGLSAVRWVSQSWGPTGAALTLRAMTEATA